MGLLAVLGLQPARPATEQGGAAAAEAARVAAEERKRLEARRIAFKQARAAWVAAKIQAEADLEKVKDGARMEYLDDPSQYPQVEKGCRDIDAILDNLDDELRDLLDAYASTPLTQTTKLQSLADAAAQVLDRYLDYVRNDPLLRAIDHKEFADVTVHAPILRALTTLRKTLQD